eukprot:m.145288 g.145288  ORF g.145288 m.145288 type:complete len:574 (+) comp38415_c0_seq3:156-1877(+)
MPRTKCKSADQRRLQSRRIKRESRARKLNCATTSDAERPRTECGRGDACIKPCWTEEDLKMNSGFIKEMMLMKGQSPDPNYSPSPSPKSSDGMERSEGMIVAKPEMRVGEDFQAVLPEFCETKVVKPDRPEGLNVWSPTDDSAVPEALVEEFVKEARLSNRYNLEQALGMLFWHKCDIKKAKADLVNFVPYPDDFNLEDRVMFEQGYQSHGKAFDKIKQLMPDKSLGNLIKFYYSWKKTRQGTSLIDRRTRAPSKRLADFKYHMDDDEDDMEEEDDEEDDEEDEHEEDEHEEEEEDDDDDDDKSVVAEDLEKEISEEASDLEPLKQTVTGSRRARKSLLSPAFRSSRVKRPPKGMLVNKSALLEMNSGEAIEIMKQLHTDLAELKVKIQSNKQDIDKNETEPYHQPEEILSLRPSVPSRRGGSSRWTSEDIALGWLAVLRYKQDYHAVTDIVGTKSIHQCRGYFTSHRRQQEMTAYEQKLSQRQSSRGNQGEEDEPGHQLLLFAGSDRGSQERRRLRKRRMLLAKEVSRKIVAEKVEEEENDDDGVAQVLGTDKTGNEDEGQNPLDEKDKGTN